MSKKALIVVDLQNDFMPGGALPVKEGDAVIPLIDKLLKQPFDVKVASKDWHPRNHGSFAALHGKKPGEIIILDEIPQILWPTHCVQDTIGAEFAPGWDTKQIEHICYKGTNPQIDSYSVFFDNEHRKSTGLADYLKERGVNSVYIAGVATDYCVKYSVMDALHLGFEVTIVADACRGVNLKAGDDQRSLDDMKAAGAHVTTVDKIVI